MQQRICKVLFQDTPNPGNTINYLFKNYMPFYPLLIKHNLVPCQSSRNSSCENGTCSAFCICSWGFGRPVKERCDLAPLCFGPLCGRRSWKPSWHLVGQFWCCFASLNSCCLRELAQQSWQVSVPVIGCRAPWGTGRAARKHRKKIQWPRTGFREGAD